MEKKTSKPISLPDLPLEKEFEEYISAYFQVAGHFVERNLIDRQQEEVLELDIIATKYEASALPKIRLVEVKSSKGGFPDIFKVRGWLDYLQLAEGILVTKEISHDDAFLNSISGALGVSVVQLGNIKETEQKLSPVVGVAAIHEDDVETWRFSYWLERNLIGRLHKKRKTLQDKKAYRAMEGQLFTLNSKLFFTKGIEERVAAIYDIYSKCPKLSAKLAQEMVGGDFDAEAGQIEKRVFAKTFYDCEFTDINISTYIEHRARLAVMKSAVDWHQAKEQGMPLREPGKDGWESVYFIPTSFWQGVAEMGKHRFYYRYPVVWQWFMWFMGGFILSDFQDREYEFLSKKSGVPVEEIPKALQAYDLLFPVKGGWFKELERIRRLTAFPPCFSGIGAHLRKALYSAKDSYDDIEKLSSLAVQDLRKWNNLVYSILSWKD